MSTCVIRILDKELLTMSSRTALDGLLDTLESFVQCWEMLEIYCCVLH